MLSPVYKAFLGAKPDLANPPFQSAKSGKNFVIHSHRDPEGRITGWIEIADGYAKKFTVLPAKDETIQKITGTGTAGAMVFDNIYNLWVPEHGGQNVTIATAPYKKTGFAAGSPTVDRFGIWIRPYWNGAAWIDAWRELTEMFIFEIRNLGVVVPWRLYIDDATYNFKTVDPTATVFATDYFKDWTIVYDAFGDTENYDIITASGYGAEFDADSYYLELVHDVADFTTRIVGTKIMVYRSFQTTELPSTLSSAIHGILSEARLTSGNSASDVSLMVGYRGKTFKHTRGPYALTDHIRTVDQVVADTGVLNIWQYAVLVGIRAEAAATDPLDAGTYYVKYSLVLDDANESKLYDAMTEGGAAGLEWSTLTAVKTITLAAGEGLRINGLFSYGALPVRGKYIRVWLSDDDLDYYRVLDFDLTLAATWGTADTTRTITTFATLKHQFAASIDTDITKTLWDAAGASAEDQRDGAATTDTGVIQYLQAAVVGRSTYAVGVRKGGTLYPNYGFVSAQSGDGAPMYDLFASTEALTIDLEYNDGDELRGVYPYGDRAIFFKRRAVIEVSRDFSLGFVRDAITKADGLCSFRTIADFENVIYWAGYNGIYAYSGRGIQLINFDWLETWKAVSTVNKEAAIATFDRVNRQYRIAYASLEWCLDIDSGEWVPADLTNQPTRYAANLRDGTVEFLSGVLIQTLGGGTRHDGTDFTMEYETNDLAAAAQGGLNAIIWRMKLRYTSSVTLSAQLYADGVALGSAVSLPAGTDVDGWVKAPLGSRCKRFSVKITATTTAAAQNVIIKEIIPMYQIIPSGVSDDR